LREPAGLGGTAVAPTCGTSRAAPEPRVLPNAPVTLAPGTGRGASPHRSRGGFAADHLAPVGWSMQGGRDTRDCGSAADGELQIAPVVHVVIFTGTHHWLFA